MTSRRHRWFVRGSSVIVLTALLACSPKPKSADDWASPVVAEGNSKPASGPKDAPAAAMTPYDDRAAGLHIDLPCSTPDKKVTNEVFGKAIKTTVVHLDCTVGGTHYALEYWTNADIIGDQTALLSTLQTMAEDSLKAKPEWTLGAKQMIDGPVGWTSYEVRSSKGDQIQVERNYQLLPRRVVLRTINTEKEGPNAERFLTALRMREEGTPFIDQPDQGASFADRTIDVSPGKLSVLLPCTPKLSPITKEKLPAPINSAQMREFECHHPSANVQYSGMYRRFDTTGEGTPAQMKAINRGFATQFASELCSAIPNSGCQPSAPKDMAKGNGSEIRITTTVYGTGRIIVDYPSIAFVLVVAPRDPKGTQANPNVPERLRAEELDRAKSVEADEIRTLASLHFVSL